mmetsp:Transcript_54061/g.161827  ORF Transcript_54061/g.161827 Transcript_54061/m.161827 type:complete len:257 (-) Transcript_54061:462-1232(-)
MMMMIPRPLRFVVTQKGVGVPIVGVVGELGGIVHEDRDEKIELRAQAPHLRPHVLAHRFLQTFLHGIEHPVEGIGRPSHARIGTALLLLLLLVVSGTFAHRSLPLLLPLLPSLDLAEKISASLPETIVAEGDGPVVLEATESVQIELTDEALKVGVLEVSRQEYRGQFLRVLHDEGRSVPVPARHVRMILVAVFDEEVGLRRKRLGHDHLVTRPSFSSSAAAAAAPPLGDWRGRGHRRGGHFGLTHYSKRERERES